MNERINALWERLEAKTLDQSKEILDIVDVLVDGDLACSKEPNSEIIKSVLDPVNESNVNLLSENISNISEKIELTTEHEEDISNPTSSIENLDFNSQESISDKIENEKRVRYQLYSELRYNLGLVSDMSFYSAEAIRLIEVSKRLTLKYHYSEVTTEMLLLAFFFVESPSLEILKKNCFTLESALGLYQQFQLHEKQKITSYQIFQVKKIFESEEKIFVILQKLMEEGLLKEFLRTYHLSFSKFNKLYRNSSYLLELIFEKMNRLKTTVWEYSVFLDKKLELVLEYVLPKFYKRKIPELIEVPFSSAVEELLNEALTETVFRFRTPVLTTDLLLLTLVEKVITDLKFESGSISNGIPVSFKENSLLATKWFENIFQNNTQIELFLLRYELLKQIHKSESSLRSQISPEQHYFAYLLKTELSEFKIRELLDNETFNSAVSEFRDTLMELSNKTSMHKQLYKDTLENIKLTSDRSYSSENTVE